MTGEPAHQQPHDLSSATAEELAAFGLRKDLASLCDRLHDAIDRAADAEVLHDIVDLWEFNGEGLTFQGLVEWGTPASCMGCARDTTPCDETGRPVAAHWHWYMATDAVWEAATGAADTEGHLCLDCLEQRIGRPLAVADLADLPVNEPSPLHVPRLNKVQSLASARRRLPPPA